MRMVWEGKDVLGHKTLGSTYTPSCVSTPPSALPPLFSLHLLFRLFPPNPNVCTHLPALSDVCLLVSTLVFFFWDIPIYLASL